MKKYCFIAALAVLSLSCQREQDFYRDPVRWEIEEDTFYASIEGQEDSGTKVYVDPQLCLLWNERDEINVFNMSTRADRYVFNGKDGDNAGSFKMLSSGTGMREPVDYNYAVYPYSEDTYMMKGRDLGTINFILPAEQQYRENSFGPGSNTMVAVSTNYQLIFNNVCGFLCFRLYGDNVPVSSISIWGNRGELIAGKSFIHASLGQYPGVVMDPAEATQTITLNCDPPVTLGPDAENYTSFWFAIPPIVFEEGFTVAVRDANGGFFSQRVTGRVEIERNVVSYMKTKKVETRIIDGSVHTLQTATTGNGINIVLMGDAYTDRLIADGTYRAVMEETMEAFFSIEPYSSFRSCFNVYYIDVVSESDVYDKQESVTKDDGSTETILSGNTALGTWFSNGTLVGGDFETIVNTYIGNAFPNLSAEQIVDYLVVVLLNRDVRAGTCYPFPYEIGDYARGFSISFIPAFSDKVNFSRIVCHEVGGHGFAKLKDEYVDTEVSGVTIPADKVLEFKELQTYGRNKNIDFTIDRNTVLWSHFLADERYANEGLGIYEGAAAYYNYGVYRSTYNSIMRSEMAPGGDVFNAPSREVIYRRIHKLAFGEDWNYFYEDFVAYDSINRGKAASSARQAVPANYVEKYLPPLHPPVIMEYDMDRALRRK